jgi:soluble lytic murein transglycosylase
MRITRDAEILLARGERETAAILLKAASPRILKAEIPFQLYCAVLLQRAGDLASSFHLLAGVFRQNPKFISKSTLQLLYPFEQFDNIQKSDPGGDPFLILSLVRQESAFNVKAISSAGAQGLMQLQWPTARQLARISSNQLWDPQINLRLGVKYLRKLENRFKGRLDYALASYNVGPERIKAWSKRYPTAVPLLFLDLFPLQETRDYVSSIARNYYWYTRLYALQQEGAGAHRILGSRDLEDGRRLLSLFGLHEWE